jgi:WhiB family redox-sensing transcriptional regulator
MPRTRDGATLPAGLNGHALHKRDTPQPWKAAGNCSGVDPALFYSEDRGAKGRTDAAAARAICKGCTVRLECLAFALTNGEEFGIWGGATERERRFMRRVVLKVRTGNAIGDVA